MFYQILENNIPFTDMIYHSKEEAETRVRILSKQNENNKYTIKTLKIY